jgi:hypothetical protein
MQIANADLIVVTEPLQEWMYGNTKSMSKVFYKYNNFTSFWDLGMVPDRVHAIPPVLRHAAHQSAPVTQD